MSSCVSAMLISLACDEHLFPRQLTYNHSLHYITRWRENGSNGYATEI